MKNEDLINVMDQRLSDQKEYINAKFTHLSAIVQTGFDFASEQREQIIRHQKETNGRVSQLEDDCDGFEKHVCNSEKLWSKRKLIMVVLGILVFGSSILATFLYHTVDVKQTIENKTGVKFLENTFDNANVQ